MISSSQLLDFSEIVDERGSLISLEANRNLPIDIKRVYYLYGTQKGAERGFHAHKELKQVLVCLNGSVDVLVDDAHTKEVYTLDKPSKGLLIQGLMWREMRNFSDDCVLVVFADEVYMEEDYIRDYEEFCEWVK